MDYVELVVDISCLSISQQDILLGKLYGFGCDSFQQEKKTLSAFVLKDSFDIELLKSCFVDDECFNLLSINNIKNQNWNAIWESSFKPVYVAGNCCVRAPFHASIHDCEIDIIINPKMSFGTGHHATTLLMMENILLLNLQNKSVLDVGSGTGILSILACKKGASGVVAIDVDSNAYSNSLENIDLNRCDGVDVFQESISDYYHNKQ